MHAGLFELSPLCCGFSGSVTALVLKQSTHKIVVLNSKRTGDRLTAAAALSAALAIHGEVINLHARKLWPKASTRDTN